jgi:holliday junction DNA helicase RuvB
VLKPELYTFELDPPLLGKLKHTVLETLGAEAKRMRVSKLTITRAKELLITVQPFLAESLRMDSDAFAGSPLLDQRRISLMLHDALAESALFFRTEGARVFREAQGTQRPEERSTALWTALFDRRLFRWLRERGYLDEPDWVESVDILVESVKVWIRDIAQRLTPAAEAISPAAFFLDTESELSAKIPVNGSVLTLSGRPDALIIDPTTQTPEIIEYKFGIQGQVELQIAQTVLYAVI